MNEITSSNVHGFLRRFQFRGARLRGLVVRNGRGETTAEVRFLIQDTQTGLKARLRMAFDGVEEHRFQRRPGTAVERLKLVSIGFFGPLAYINLDAFPEDGPPKVMDFRASDCFMAGRTIRWEVIE